MYRALLLGCLLFPPFCPADEAVRPDGRRLRGTLQLEKSGLFFQPASGGRISLGDLRKVRLEGFPAPFRATPVHVLRLAGDEQLTGVFVGLERDNLVLRTAWADRLLVPRLGTIALTHLPGWRTIFHDPLAGKWTAWRVEGSPLVASGELVLAKPGQGLAHAPATPIAAGRIAVNFREQGNPAGARWIIETRFADKAGERLLRVTLAGAGENLHVDAPGSIETPRKVARSVGPHRLWIEFGPRTLRILRDDDVIGYTLEQGPGTLRQVRLACVPTDPPGSASGNVAFSNFVLDRAVPTSRRPRGDRTQDELWLAGGDQLFGKVVRADGSGIELQGRFGKRVHPWSQLRGWFLPQRTATSPRRERGTAVRIHLHSGLQASRDLLEGSLTELSGRTLKLRHPVLGEVVLPRSHVEAIEPLDPAPP